MIGGVNWKTEKFEVKGKQWKTAYLPVWLYSYQENKGEDSIIHYVAVNSRTKETMGSVPIHTPKLVVMSILVELLGILLIWLADFDYKWLFLLAGFVYYFIMKLRYRNSNARHNHETETKKSIFNLKKSDKLIKHQTGLTNSKIIGANNKKVSGQSMSETMLNTLTNNLNR